MKLELEFYGALCETKTFKINNVKASYDDFGEKFDHSPENAPDYCCGDMRFDSKPPLPEVLDRYHISINEYDDICEKLREGLSFGSCGWCE